MSNKEYHCLTSYLRWNKGRCTKKSSIVSRTVNKLAPINRPILRCHLVNNGQDIHVILFALFYSYQLIPQARLEPNTHTSRPVYNRVYRMGTVCPTVFCVRQQVCSKFLNGDISYPSEGIRNKNVKFINNFYNL